MHDRTLHPTAPNDFSIEQGLLLRYTGTSTDVCIPSGVTGIAPQAFHGGGAIRRLTIPKDVSSIASDALSGCTGLEQLTLPLACLYGAAPVPEKTITAAVFSDTHGSISRLYQIAQELPKIDLLLHAGDFASDGVEMASELGVPCYAVAGNCDDFPIAGPQERSVSFGGVRLLLQHGYRFFGSNTSISLYAQSKGCGVALTGHTHKPLLAWQEGCLIVNPGSFSFPRGGTRAGYALLSIRDGCLTARLCRA